MKLRYHKKREKSTQSAEFAIWGDRNNMASKLQTLESYYSFIVYAYTCEQSNKDNTVGFKDLLANIITLFVCPPKILYCFYILLGLTMIPRETEKQY